jgi:hypothetical protein
LLQALLGVHLETNNNGSKKKKGSKEDCKEGSKEEEASIVLPLFSKSAPDGALFFLTELTETWLKS